jgi:hypothetical protein
MKFVIALLFMMGAQPLFAQKKMIPVTQSEFTGIALPEGSRIDKRGLSDISARLLLEMESKKNGSKIGKVEILSLPPATRSGYTADSLLAGLTAMGWSIAEVKEDPKFVWLTKEGSFLMAYFSLDAKETALYFGIPATPPALQPAVQQPQAVDSN